MPQQPIAPAAASNMIPSEIRLSRKKIMMVGITNLNVKPVKAIVKNRKLTFPIYTRADQKKCKNLPREPIGIFNYKGELKKTLQYFTDRMLFEELEKHLAELAEAKLKKMEGALRSASLKLDKGKTALLMADFHTESMGENPIVRERQIFERAKEVLDAE